MSRMIETEHFIESLKTRPYLFDKQAKGYRNYQLQNIGWAAVAKDVGRSGSAKELKKWATHKWRLLRTEYCRERSRLKNMAPEEGGYIRIKDKSRWKYFHKMLYFDDFISVRTPSHHTTLQPISKSQQSNGTLSKTADNCVEIKEEDEERSLSPLEFLNLHLTQNRIPESLLPKSDTSYIHEDNIDSIIHFVNFMGEELKTLPKNLRNAVQFKIHQVLIEAKSDV